jgi:glutamine synthetase
MEVNDKTIKWVNLLYTTLIGELKQVTVSHDDKFEEKSKTGFGKLDGSSIPGFKDIYESDLVLKPDLATMRMDPFQKETALIISDIYEAGGKQRFVKDPRWVAIRTESYVEELGFKALVAAEAEFYIFDDLLVWVDSLSSGYKIKSREASASYKRKGLVFKNGYHAPLDLDYTYEIRNEISSILGNYFDIQVESHHHEVGAAGQVEINIKASNPLSMSDSIQLLKYVAKLVCYNKGKLASFLPKPIPTDNGSGLHIHVSLWRGDINLFYDEDDDYAQLSQLARYFIGGLIEHGKALSAIVSPTVNSYKRLVPHYEAPIYLVWGKSNRSAAIRIPSYNGSPLSKRIEYRPPDPSANPYLAISAVILAGLDGIKKKIEPGDPLDLNIYKLSENERKRLGIKSLPGDLREALDELENDHEFLLQGFTKELISSYLEVKRKEWEIINRHVTPAEIYYYSYL